MRPQWIWFSRFKWVVYRYLRVGKAYLGSNHCLGFGRAGRWTSPQDEREVCVKPTRVNDPEPLSTGWHIDLYEINARILPQITKSGCLLKSNHRFSAENTSASKTKLTHRLSLRGPGPLMLIVYGVCDVYHLEMLNPLREFWRAEQTPSTIEASVLVTIEALLQSS